MLGVAGYDMTKSKPSGIYEVQSNLTDTVWLADLEKLISPLSFPISSTLSKSILGSTMYRETSDQIHAFPGSRQHERLSCRTIRYSGMNSYPRLNEIWSFQAV